MLKRLEFSRISKSHGWMPDGHPKAMVGHGKAMKGGI